MTTYSRSDLATRALRKAGIIGAEETPSAADLDYAEEMISSDTAALKRRGITMWNGSDQAVPLEQLEPRAAYHAISLKADFGMMTDAEAIQVRKSLELDLRRMDAKEPTGAVLEAEYF